MQDNTSWTPPAEDNLLNLTDKNLINEQEAKGIVLAELHVLDLDIDEPVSSTFILELHKIAFGHLYDWAGKWRTKNVLVGQLEPPQPYQIVQLMYQFVDNLNFKISIAETKEEHIDCLLYAHYEFIGIHPFNNGNGRAGRIIMNLTAMKCEGESRKVYIDAIKAADKRNFELLRNLISNELSVF